MAELWVYSAVFSASETPVIKPVILPLPKTSRIPGPRQHIIRLSRRRWLLGPSLPFGLVVGCLLHDWGASNGLLCSAYPFCATLGRCFMPGLVVNERLSESCLIDLETVPFWASLSSGFGWFRMTTPQCTFSCLIHSRFPDRFCIPAEQSRLCFPLSTRVYQAHAEGKGCLPFTREAGVVAIPLVQYPLPAWICSYENQKRLSPLIPHPCEWFRANRSHRIDAAGGVKVKTAVVCAAASVLVELSRIWKKKPGGSGENISKTQCPPIKDRSGEYFT
jgi:hypothetical protein